ncbi:SPOR domain-containing protein [Aquisalinus flavus]|nr:SPOR domain-containing protein [Aquisalinus flavus]MBD0426676.1 SPOR domain-containing protein [Aquisalinus flavus]
MNRYPTAIGPAVMHRAGMVIMIASGVVLTACESFSDDLPAAPGEPVSASVSKPSLQGTARSTPDPYGQDPYGESGSYTGETAPAADPAQRYATQGGTAPGVPAAPYTSTPRYDSQYPDYWESVQEDSASIDDLRRAEQDGLIVTDGAVMPSRPRQYPGQTPASADPGYADAGATPPMPQRAATAQPVTGSAYGGEPEIPEAPVSTPSYGSRNASPRRGSDGLPVYGETQAAATPERRPASSEAARPTAGGLYGLHLASYRVIDNAYSGWDVLLGRNTEELGLLEPRIAAADIPGLGLHYRLKAGPLATREEAISLCERIKSGGDYCAVMAFDGDPL